MKKFFTLALVALMGVSASFAQVKFGAKVGFDMTNFWGEDVNHGMKPAYQAGVFMEYKFNSSFGVAPEIVFASQGGKFKISDKKTGVGLIDQYLDKKQTYTTNYINIPVMFKWYATPNFSIDFGPQLGINVYSKYSIEDVDKSVDLKDNTNAVDFGLGLGGTYNLAENVFLQARYTMGLTKTFDIKDYDCKNGNIQISFGYRF